EHDARTAPTHDPEALPDRQRQLEWRTEPGEHSLAAQAAHGNPFDFDLLRRDELRFQSALRAEPHGVVAALAQHACGGERWKHMSARAARHDEHRAALHGARSRRDTASRPAVLAS